LGVEVNALDGGAVGGAYKGGGRTKGGPGYFHGSRLILNGPKGREIRENSSGFFYFLL